MANSCYNTMFVEGNEENISKLEELISSTPEDAWPKHILPLSAWGTKWVETINLDRDEEDSLDLRFNSAWAPPIGVYEKLKELDYVVTATYWEGGCGLIGMWVDGDHYSYDLTQMDESNYKNIIHSDLLDDYSVELEEYYSN